MVIRQRFYEQRFFSLRNEIILFILLLLEKMLLSLHAEALKEWQAGILDQTAAFGAFAFLFKIKCL